MTKKMNILYMGALALVMTTSCGSDEPGGGDKPGGGDNPGSGSVTDVRPVSSLLSIDLSTDKAVYKPGETVHITASSTVAGAKVRYRQGASVVAEGNASAAWDWTPPATDFTGYLVEVYTTDGSKDVIHGTIAVDVSSDWKKFPRYGFVATFDDSKLAQGTIEKEMEYLNRCHINGVQFQDWHWKHHWPLAGTREKPLDRYKDIANRDVNLSVVRKYIDIQHGYGMKSIFYNLCFGVLDDAQEDGVQKEWYVFKDTNHSTFDFHDLPSGWKSDIFLVNPGDKGWLSYIGDRTDDVYAVLDFDGYQVDQLGNRGTLYDYYGTRVNMGRGYADFLSAMKQRQPEKSLIMNAVSSYCAQNIAGSGNVDFCYNEVWDDEKEYKDLYNIIRANDTYSDGSLATVFAAYMNYGLSGSKGSFNTPGVLLTDAVMHAIGGSHLELGDHMLGSEYFPNNNLQMPQELRTSIIRYYDFITAYQNLLRGTDSRSEFKADVTCTDPAKGLTFNAWPPKAKTVTTYARDVDGKKVISLLNFRNVTDMSWRDLQGTQRAPMNTAAIPVSIPVTGNVRKVWVATPDYHAGAVQELAFEVKDGKLTCTIPQLRYWTMLVIE